MGHSCQTKFQFGLVPHIDGVRSQLLCGGRIELADGSFPYPNQSGAPTSWLKAPVPGTCPCNYLSLASVPGNFPREPSQASIHITHPRHPSKTPIQVIFFSHLSQLATLDTMGQSLIVLATGIHPKHPPKASSSGIYPRQTSQEPDPGIQPGQLPQAPSQTSTPGNYPLVIAKDIH